MVVKTESDLLALAERCEHAAAPDRELDEAIAVSVGITPRYGFNHYTASLDAALMLLPGRDWEWSLEWESGTLLYHPDLEQYACAKIGDPTLRMEAECATPALALCAAALRARAQPPSQSGR